MPDEHKSRVLGRKITIPIEFEVIYDPNTSECTMVPIRVEAAEVRLQNPESKEHVGRVGASARGEMLVEVAGYMLQAAPLDAWRAAEEKLLEVVNPWEEQENRNQSQSPTSGS